jgi:UDP-N-acetylmuramoylalanine--D-glutamate ligase
MTLENLRNQRVGILGFGQEGQAIFKYLGKNQIKATILDITPLADWGAEAQSLAGDAPIKPELITGADYLNELQSFKVLFRSPGIPRLSPEILAAEENGTIITSQTKWFFEHCPAPIIGVTGTKGKGTTCSLINEILLAANKSSYLTGNIGKIQPLDFLDRLTQADLVVYELSSFQLQDLTQSPHIGICLMVTSDHLDHHKSLGEYHQAKSAITKFQSAADMAIFNADYPTSLQIGRLGHGKKYAISKMADSAVPEIKAIISGESIQIGETTIDCSARKLRGAHNLENIAAAAMAGLKLGVEPALIEQIANDFAGLEHRLQFVAKINDVSYYNDSISTVPETTIAALNSFEEPVHLILGGYDKGLPYHQLVADLTGRTNVASIALIGEVGNKLQKLFADIEAPFPVYGPIENFAEAFHHIAKIAKPGDIVMLSPAAASFGMFKNYADRGHQFVELVTELQK